MLTEQQFTMPDVAAYSNLDTSSTGVKAVVSIAAVPGTLSHSNTAGQLIGISVAWGTSNNDVKYIPASALTQFTRLSPGNALTVTPPAIVTVMDPTQYWNGTALIPIPGNPNQATVQRLLYTVRGNFVWQYGEVLYTNLVAAQNNILQATFTNILPEGTYAEIGRMAITASCTDLNSSLAQYYPSGGGGGGGTGSAASVNWGAIQGSIDDQLDLKARLDQMVTKMTDVTISGTAFTVDTDNTRYICTSTSPVTATVASTIIGNIEVLRYGTGTVTFIAGAGTTLRYSTFNSPSIVEQYCSVGLTKLVSVGEIRIYGELTSI
jgi:hypothetical protein